MEEMGTVLAFQVSISRQPPASAIIRRRVTESRTEGIESLRLRALFNSGKRQAQSENRRVPQNARFLGTKK